MFSFRNDPGTDGAGVAFTDRQDGFSTGMLGSLNLGRTDLDDLAALRANLAAVRTALGVGPVVAVHQVHGVEVLDVDDALLAGWTDDSWLGDSVPGARRLPVADALVTTRPGVVLAIRVADCVPVLFADPAAGVVAAAHAGRVGLAAGVLTTTLARMREHGATAVTAWIGPHICGACYEVPAAMRDELAARLPGAATTTSWGTPALDLGAAANLQLQAAGCQVRRHDPCTLTVPTLHSHRRDGAGAGRQLGLVWLPAG
ncbi:MAG: laccase domain-containing protein [Propionicimonas sp.]|uniref:laccase domain-containing protein n=1 Tax=Propionicimonas sp. TaxID=1955623 RepID=UPI002B1EF308|nr:laccase domain-containing protein [Propionicimonas sp.]MEA4943003.1 laccase domain-containing protein [Propionicimonas sp.]